MYRPRYNELERFLEWRKQTRFIRHYGGPILAVGLFMVCLWFVYQALESRQVKATKAPLIEANRMQEIDHTLQAAKISK
jgi:hypothetical protein